MTDVAVDACCLINLAGQHGVALLTTAELLKRWATKTKASQSEIAAALQNIQRFARFVPRSNSPEASWWLSHLQGV